MSKKASEQKNPIIQKRVRETMGLSIKDGAWTSVATNSSMSYFSPAAIAMGATSVQMGILFAIISLLPNLVQLKTASLLERFRRKNIVLAGALGKVILIIPFLIIGFLHWRGVPYMIWAFISVVGFYYVCTAVLYPAWFSWIGSVVPGNERGAFFSKRKRVLGFFGIITMILSAILLDYFKKIGILRGDLLGFTLIGFGLLFVISGIARMFSWWLLKREYEPAIKIRKRDHFSLKDFLEHSLGTPFGRFSLFAGAFTLVVGVSSPFWSVYMLRNLNFSYIWYMLITVSELAFQLMFLPLIGKFSDKFGNIKLMKMSSILAGAVPLLWVASSFIKSDILVKIYLLTIPAIIGGVGWAGYNLALSNYVYDAVGDRKRSFGLSYMNLIIGVGGFLGAGIGAFIAWTNVSFMVPILFIFTISGIGRIAVGIFGSKFLHEVRNVREFSPRFWVKEFAPMRGVAMEIHNLEHLTEKVEYYVDPRKKEGFARSERLKQE